MTKSSEESLRGLLASLRLQQPASLAVRADTDSSADGEAPSPVLG